MQPSPVTTNPAARSCRFCGSAAIIGWGTWKGSPRYRCKTCSRTQVEQRGVSGNHLPLEQHHKILELLQGGLSIRQTCKATGAARNTVMMRSRSLTVLCPCGKNARHKEWCAWRISQSPNRQEYLKRVTKPRISRLPRPAPLQFYPYLGPGADPGDLLKAVHESVPRSIDNETRSEVCQEILLALLQGEASLVDLQAGGWRTYLKRYYKEFGNKWGPLSLDAPVGRDGEGRKLSEMVADLRDVWGSDRPALEFRDRHGVRQVAQRGTVPDIDLRRRPVQASTGVAGFCRGRFENIPSRLQRISMSHASRFTATPTVRIDLHGLTRAAALTRLDQELNASFMRSRRDMEVVVGRGDVLFPAVEDMLDGHPLVDTFRPDGGRFFVRLAAGAGASALE